MITPPCKKKPRTEVFNTPAEERNTLNYAKEHIHHVMYNLHSYPYPSFVNPRGEDLSWMNRKEIVDPMNVHLVLKLHLWMDGYASTSNHEIQTHTSKMFTVDNGQDKFAQEVVPKAISGIAACKIPVWMMSPIRMVQLIDGVEDLAVAELIANISSYGQFDFEYHISLASPNVLYALTIHHSPIFESSKKQNDNSLTTCDVFYGINKLSHIV